VTIETKSYLTCAKDDWSFRWICWFEYHSAVEKSCSVSLFFRDLDNSNLISAFTRLYLVMMLTVSLCWKAGHDTMMLLMCVLSQFSSEISTIRIWLACLRGCLPIYRTSSKCMWLWSMSAGHLCQSPRCHLRINISDAYSRENSRLKLNHIESSFIIYRFVNGFIEWMIVVFARLSAHIHSVHGNVGLYAYIVGNISLIRSSMTARQWHTGETTAWAYDSMSNVLFCL
jgi:hypothetical protein